MFPRARHLNLMDKIRSHIIQMNSNPRSLSSRVSDARTSNSGVSDSEVLEALDSGSQIRVLRVSDPRPVLRGSGPETFLGFDLGW